MNARPNVLEGDQRGARRRCRDDDVGCGKRVRRVQPDPSGEVVPRSGRDHPESRQTSAPGVFVDWDFAARNLRSSRWLHKRVDVDFNGWFM